MENNENVLNEEVVLQEPAKVEKVTLSEINQEKVSEENEKTDDLVRRIMNKILEIK